MQAVLYVCHGSRVTEACHEAVSFVKRCQAGINVPIQEICFIELAEPNIAQGIAACINKGATNIVVIPVLLLKANHLKHDIPQEIARANKHYPQITITLTQPFGVHEKIVQVIAERIREQQVSVDNNTMVLLVGRGSSDPDVKNDLQQIARLLHEHIPIPRIEVCFLAAAQPSLEAGLDDASRSSCQKVFVVPCLLFTGVLMKRLTNKLKRITTPEKQFILCNYLGYHPLLQELLHERVSELTNLQTKRG